MKKILYTLFLLIFLSGTLHAQKVGLVLSGGGAKGLTHIGIIRALEENNIPIDYIAGTSMGAIIGSLYAMGYSPDDMEKLLKSDSFKRWYTGNIEEKYIYYFKKNPPTPEFINIRVSLKNPLHKVKTQFLPSSVVDPLQMNLAFLELFGQATAACQNDFDKLFIPFRCVASDVYNKKPMIFENGDLGDAVRASMSFPGMFKPIEIDSTLVYDGGIYNNFPVNVMVNDFHPDVIIGSVVSSNPGKPQEGDIMGQLENMIMQKTDYSLPDSLGILMTFKYDNVNLMDFDRFDELHDNGYKRTMQLMDSIKARIPRRVNYRQLELKRIAYKKNMPELRFRDINIQGGSEQQKRYIRKEFHTSDQGLFSLEDLRKGYFRLMSDNMISEIIPHAVYNPADSTFNLHLKVKIEDDLSLRVGGNVGSNGANQIYIGGTYHNLNNFSKEVSLDGQLGQIYNNLQISGRIDIPTYIPTSFRLVASTSSFDYFKQEKIFTKGSTPVFNKKKEHFVKLLVSLPFLTRQKAEFGIGIGKLQDQYFQSNVIDFNNDKNDISRYTIFGGSVAMDGNTLNSKQYPTAGRRERLVANIYTGREYFQGGSTPDPYNGSYNYVQSWLQVSYEMERYYPLSSRFVLGNYIHAYYSSRNFSQNYTATMMQAGEFAPTAHSKITYNEAFRANQFIGAGVMPIFQITPVFHVRAEVYGFAPIFPIVCNEESKASYGKLFSRIEYMGELSLVVKLPFGAISAYLNHYSSPSKNWNIGLTLGWQIFGSRFIE
ncbi:MULTISPECIES: patatin-like phospholipase family protein [unclassified Phocaeicola]|jgi:NTE family protein|uniref:patatin-like phospholipase family protein n=1 Tax=unclassified Phocaeicola TaxID=2762211 RepID=UPI00033495B1|nr:phospholipase patatin family [Bacteroides sp. CAG:1076]